LVILRAKQLKDHSGDDHTTPSSSALPMSRRRSPSARTGRVASVRVESQLAVTITGGAIAGVKAWLGVVASSLNSVRAELESGALVRILSDWDFGSPEVNALFASGNIIKPAARAFTDSSSGSFDADFTEHSWRLWI
jgi:DNA-binding transcriptional LysR family regulator